MTHKKVNNADAGTATKFGGNDLDKWSDFASGTDTDDYDINSDIQFRLDKLQIRNSANTFGHKFRSNATAARTMTMPDGDIDVGDALVGTTWLIYKSGSNYKAKSGYLGYVPTAAISTSMDTIWAYLRASTFDPTGSGDVNYGGSIVFARGIYTFTGTADIDSTFPGVAGNAAIRIRGQGFGTRLQFTATLDSGIRFNGTGANFCGIEDMRVMAADAVTNIIRINGNAPRCLLRNLDIRNSNSTKVTGQRGIYIDASTPDVYYSYLSNIHFRYLDQALDMTGSPNAVTIHMVEMWDCNKGLRLTGGLHQLTNIKMQATATIGDYVIDVAGNQCQIANVWADGMTKAGAYPVIIETGAAANSVVNVINSSDWDKCILDNSLHADRRILAANTGFDVNTLNVFVLAHPFATTSITTNTAVYMTVNSGLVRTTEALAQATVPFKLRVFRAFARLQANTKDGNTIITLRDDGADVTGTDLVIPAASTSEIDSGAIDTVIAKNSKLCWEDDSTASTSGGYVIGYAYAYAHIEE